MRNRKLTRTEAIEEWLVYRIRLDDLMHIFEIEFDINEGKYRPENRSGHNPSRFFNSLQTISVGLFASLMDKDERTINVIDVWRALFPEKDSRIVETWEKKIKPVMPLIRDYRNEVAFHGRKDLYHYLNTQIGFLKRFDEVAEAIKAFLALSAELSEYSNTILYLDREIEPVFKKIFPALNASQLEEWKEYLIYGRKSFGVNSL